MGSLRLIPDDVTALTSMLGELPRSAGFTYDGESLNVPVELDPVVNAILADPNWRVTGMLNSLRMYAANKALTVQQGGISVMIGTQSVIFSTDIATVTKLRMSMEYASMNQAAPQLHAFPAGIALNNTDLATVQGAILSHWSEVAMTLAAVIASIESGDITTTADIDAAAWPGMTQ